MPGPARKSSALKIISGTSRKDREPAATPGLVTQVPPAPDWLPNAHALKEWDRLAPLLVANKQLSEVGLSALGMLCSLHGKLVELWSAGVMPTGHMLAQYRALVNDFAPGAQSKTAGEAPAVNRFSRNGKRPA